MNKEKIYKIILQGLFFLALISPLVVNRKMFYPYVTPGGLYFRLIVELLFSLWLIFVLFYPKYRPRLNLLINSSLIFLIALTFATIFSSNPYLSLWGDAERMMGLFSYFHFFTFFIIGTSLFKKRRDLKVMLQVFIVISSIVSIYGILQKFGLTSIKPDVERIVSTLGNAGVLAGYLIFSLFYSLYLGLKESKLIFKLIYGASFVLHLIAIYLTGTRGAYLGVVFGLFIFAIFLIINFKEKRALRRNIVVGLILLAIIYGILFINQDKDFVKSNSYLYRLTQFSLDDPTIKARLMVWDWGFKGFRDKPFIGYGLEQFAIPYNKYFSADYYDIAPGKPYFDRAHNIIIELMSTSGIMGLAAYIFLIFTILFYLFKQKTNKEYFAVFLGLFSAYFIQNLFIFDMLPAMLGFMVFLVIVNNYNQKPEEDGIVDKNKIEAFIIIPIIFILVIGLCYSFTNYIIKPYHSLKANVMGQVLINADYNKGFTLLIESVEYDNILDLDIRTAAANTLFNYYMDNQIQNNNTVKDIGIAINLYQDNLEHMPMDMYYNYKLAELLNLRFAFGLEERFIPEAREHIEKAISASPNRARLYYILAENYLMSGELKRAEETIEQAISLNDRFGETYWEATKIYFETLNYEKSKESLYKTVDLGYKLNEETIMGLNGLFNIKADPHEEIAFLELVIKNGTDNYIIYSTLATRYYEVGNWEKAIENAEISVELNPATKETVKKFIERVNNSAQAEENNQEKLIQ